MGAKVIALALVVVAACVAVLIHTGMVVERVQNELSSTRRELAELKKAAREAKSNEDKILRFLKEHGESVDSLRREIDGLGMQVDGIRGSVAALAEARQEPTFDIPASSPKVPKPSTPVKPETVVETPVELPHPEIPEWKKRFSSGLESAVARQFKLAAQEFGAVLALRPDDWLVRQRLVDVLLLSDSYKSALEHLLETIRRCEGKLSPGTLLECFNTREEFDAWVEELQKQPLSEKLGYSDRALLLGYAYYCAGMHQDAMMILAGVSAHHKEAIKLTDMAKEAMREGAEKESKKGE